MAKRRPSGDGMVRKRDDGRWEGCIVVGHKENGQPIFHYALARTQKKLLDKLHRDIALYQEVELTEDGRMTLGQWLDRWMEDYAADTLRSTTQACYEGRIYRHIIPELGKIPLNQLSQKDLQQFFTEMKKGGRLIRAKQFGPGLSDSMVRGCHITCRAALEKAVQEGMIRSNPSAGCKLPPK